MSYYYRHDEMLETIARNVISQYDPMLLLKPSMIPVEDIMEKVYNLSLEFQYIRKNGRILGETVFEDAEIPIYEYKDNEGYTLIPVKAGTVIIDASLLHNQSDGRFQFTCAHELAHWVIDKNYFMQLGETANMTCGEADTEFANELLEANKTVQNDFTEARAIKSSDTSAAVERQANRMASRILMPKCTVKMAFYDARNNTHSIIADLAELYSVSKQAMKIRLNEIGLLH